MHCDLICELVLLEKLEDSCDRFDRLVQTVCKITGAVEFVVLHRGPDCVDDVEHHAGSRAYLLSRQG